MISDDALYNFLQSQITAAASGDALFDVQLYRTMRGVIDVASVEKVIRIDISSGMFEVAHDNCQKEKGVETTVQCFARTAAVVSGVTTELDVLDAATEVATQMARAVFDAVMANQTLNGEICSNIFDVFERNPPNIEANGWGCCYLYGVINPANEGA